MFRKFKFTGGYFESPTEWDLFGDVRKKDGQIEELTRRVSFVFGRNGYGKSSFVQIVGDAFNEDKNNNSENLSFATDENNGGIPLNDYSIHIFGDKFIQDNVLFHDESLGAIVMLGAQKEHAEELERLRDDQADLAEKLEQKQLELNAFDEKGNSDCIEDAKKACRRDLKNYAIRVSELKGNKNAARIDDEMVEHFKKIACDETKNGQIKGEFEEKKHDLERLKSIVSPVADVVGREVPLGNLEKTFSLLEKQLTKPVGGEYVDRLDRVLQHNSSEITRENVQSLAEGNDEYCPLCLRPIGKEDKEVIIDALNVLFNEDADSLLEEIRSVTPAPIELDWLGDYEEQFTKEVSDIRASALKAIHAQEELERYVKSKEDSPWQSISVKDRASIQSAYEGFNQKVKELAGAVKSLNLLFSKKETVLREAQALNEKLGRIEASSSLNRLKTVEDKQAKVIADIESVQKDIHLKKDEVSALQEKCQDTALVTKLMNESLSRIFLAKDRMRLEPSDMGYKVMSRGRSVKLSRLSTGERHIISLVYFFAKLCEGKTEDQIFSDKMLLLIDDPVSSLDGDVKLGLFGYLKDKMRQLLSGNKLSQICILSHDYFTVCSLEKARADLCLGNDAATWKRIGQNKELLELKIRSFNDYKYHLDNCYQSAKDGGSDGDTKPYPMNEMRRVMEAYSTFVYSKEFDKMVADLTIIDRIKDPQIKEGMKNSTFRIVLNTLSHSKEPTDSSVLLEELDYFEPEIQLKALKMSLLFLWGLDQTHVESLLKTMGRQEKEIRSTMNAWKNELFPLGETDGQKKGLQ